MAKDTLQYTQDTEEEDNHSLFTSALKVSLLYAEDWDLSNDNTELNSETSANAPNEHLKANQEPSTISTTTTTNTINDSVTEDKNLKQASKVRFVNKQPAPSTLKNSLGRIIGSKKSINTPIIPRNLFQNTLSTPITPFNTDNYTYNNTEINHEQKDHPEIPHNHGKIIPIESHQSDRFATIRNPYTGNNTTTDKMKKTTSRNENHTDKVDHGNEEEKD
jgi:hypothetical protein